MSLLHEAVVIDNLIDAQYHLRADKMSFYEWSRLSCEYTLTTAFMDAYFDKLNIKRLIIYQTLEPAFIDKYADQLDWHILPIYQTLSADLVEKYNSRFK